MKTKLLYVKHFLNCICSSEILSKLACEAKELSSKLRKKNNEKFFNYNFQGLHKEDSLVLLCIHSIEN